VDNFETYYNGQFREDIQTFFATIPDNSKFHEDIQNRRIYSIQYDRLTLDFDHLNFLCSRQHKVNFGVALFLTILVDEVCYTYFKTSYDSFSRQTLYPKFIGNCPSGCHYHLHPREIFVALNYSRKNNQSSKSSDHLDFSETFVSSLPIMEKETKHFFKCYLPHIDEQEFWSRCLSEMPYRVV